MNNGTDNRRVKYSKMVLKESLLRLMKKQPISKITVTDICREADVNRGTFYLHYSDTYDLLEQIQKELLDNIMVSVDKLMKSNADSTLIIKEMFEVIAKNKRLCQIILSDNGDKNLLKDIINLTREKVINEWQIAYKGINVHDMDCLYTYTSNGVIGIIQQWIFSDFRETPAKMSAFVDRISKECINSLLK